MNLSKILNEKNLTIADQTIVSGGNFLLNILIAKILSLDNLGTFTLCWLALLLASSIHQAFILGAGPNAITKRKATGTLENYIYHLTVLNLVTVTFCFIGTYILALIYFNAEQPNPMWLATPLAFLVSTFVFYDFGRKMNQNLSRTKKTLLSDLLVLMAQLVSMAGLYYFGIISLINLLWCWALIYGLAGLTLNVSIISKTKFQAGIFLEIALEHWNFGKWLIATSLVQWFSGNIYLITAAALLGNKVVGVIRLLQNVVGILHILFISFEIYIPIKAAELYLRNGNKAMIDYVVSFAVQGLGLTIAIVLIICTFSPQILSLLYHSNTSSDSSLLCFFAIFYIVVFSAIPLRIILRTVGDTKSLFIAYIINLALSVSLAKPLILQYGTTGVILGYLISNIVTNLYYLIAANKHMWQGESSSLV